jgi:hypothetical protein
LINTVAARDPPIVGRKVREMVHVAPTFNLLPHVVDVIAYSFLASPPTVATGLPNVTAEPVLFATVTDLAALVTVNATLPKSSGFGETVRGTTAVPVNVTVAGVDAGGAVIVSEPLTRPACVVGAKVTVITHDPPGATEPVQPAALYGAAVLSATLVRLVARLFCSVTLSDAREPCATFPNARLEGVAVIWATPVPESDTVILFEALAVSVTTSVPVRAPAAVG